MSAVLVADRLTRRYGGLTAINSVCWTLEQGEIHAVIGPNGAGKTTFLNLLSGVTRPDGGTIEVVGKRLEGRPAHVFARHGVGRSFQRTNIFDSMTAQENVKTAALVHLDHAFRFVKPFAAYRRLEEEAERALSLVGLQERCHVQARALSYGEQRMLEIAMVLATRPSIVLLDEPMSGIGYDETRRVTELIAGLKHDHSVILIEHDLSAVFSLADRLTVLVNGTVAACGSVEEVRADKAVQEAYLGE
ncbi:MULTISPECIES: ABC transporter ATP-binding protein [unclassified Hwanghaeella]|jgi:branched-chain amino acid transport system ATP-binding protein|uniref:ABC transporter ATP-binding protein n=2 Tax=Alphaproteobacteria TaxID=28211 RepID=UPI000C38B7AF|nr:ABC transporter ATP-binding protein [Rhodospirillaceae bacterium]MAX64874.1 ABC transporter ATP-binding protein [Rhodospirillaceae bacterium]MBB57107.1 ABC transporter ATP-binding protein [Rhodospirillaceae bacterium]|tara:strand:- start:34764 stop:35504 length:741 start_codon:yes stop_codon:yes gene_type:complete